MRHRTFVLAAAAVAVVAACHRAPPELGEVDAAAPSGSASVAPAAASSPDNDTPVARGEPDSGVRAALHAFCSGAFSADEERLLTQSMGRAAAGVCASDFATALGRARADFDAEAGRKCVEMLHQKQLAQMSETDTLFQHFPCDRVLLGLQPEGQACRFSIECKDGLACVGYKIGADGACKKPPAVKEACTLQPYGSLVNEAASALHHPACAPGAYCDGTTCQARVPPGKACGKSETCGAGLSCVMGKCGLRAGTGALCAGMGDCAFGLWCDAGAGKCAAKRAEGQECTSLDACKGRCEIPKKPDGHPAGPGKCLPVCGSG